MSHQKSDKLIRRAFVSLYYKEESLEFCSFLYSQGIEIVASGGTASYLTDHDIPVVPVSSVTHFTDILKGRVKTLHPAVFGGILAKQSDESDQSDLDRMNIRPFDLVLVNLYPFNEAVDKQLPLEKAIELIDIGGSALIRAAAKNCKDVVVLVDPSDIKKVMNEMETNQNNTCFDTRLQLAVKAFQRSVSYDNSIQGYLQHFTKKGPEEEDAVFPEQLTLELSERTTLKYGENPHQAAAFYKVLNERGFSHFDNISKRKLSFNNLFDLSAAYDLVWEFEKPAAAIIKHATPCGVAIDDVLANAYSYAHECDPVSAYGSIIAFNRPIDSQTAEVLHSTTFIEAVVAPAYEEGVLKKLMKKKKRRFITCPPPQDGQRSWNFRWIGGGFLLQQNDRITHQDDLLKVVTKRQPTEEEMDDLLFAWAAVKHVRSNAILLARDKRSVGIGGGQTSRVDSTKIAIEKAGDRCQGSVLASDAFFPFRDSIDLIQQYGIKAVIQPGGSIRDEEVIEACDEFGITMVFTGVRHFKHQ